MKHERGSIQLSQLHAFRAWLTANGVEWREGKGSFQAMQVYVNKQWQAICVNAQNVVSTPRALSPYLEAFFFKRNLPADVVVTPAPTIVTDWYCPVELLPILAEKLTALGHTTKLSKSGTAMHVQLADGSWHTASVADENKTVVTQPLYDRLQELLLNTHTLAHAQDQVAAAQHVDKAKQDAEQPDVLTDLRDDFAHATMKIALDKYITANHRFTAEDQAKAIAAVSRFSYQMADAMLQARKNVYVPTKAE